MLWVAWYSKVVPKSCTQTLIELDLYDCELASLTLYNNLILPIFASLGPDGNVTLQIGARYPYM